jgi:hypothetical protein
MQFPIEPFVVSGEGVLIPPDRDRWVTAAMFDAAGHKPSYTVIEVAHVFFGKSPHWLRKRMWERQDRFQVDRTDAGHRRFGLHRIEDLAHILLEDGAISPLQFAMTIRIIKSTAILNMYEIGDSGFLLDHWNGAQMLRREIITQLMDRLEHWDAKRAQRHPSEPTDAMLTVAARVIRDYEIDKQEARKYDHH